MSQDDLERANREARQQFLEEQRRATYGGQPPSDDRLQGAQEGWDAAIEFIKRRALLRLLG